MKLKALLLALFTAGLLVSAAIAATPEKKGKPTVAAQSTASTGSSTGTSTGTTTTSGKGKSAAKRPDCKPAKKLQLRGELASAPTASGFAMKVERANRGAKALKGMQVTIVVDEHTKVRGKRKLAEAAAGDRVTVQGYACKANLANLAASTIVARHVHVKPKKADEPKSTTSTATTTGTTTSAP